MVPALPPLPDLSLIPGYGGPRGAREANVPENKGSSETNGALVQRNKINVWG